MATAAAFSVKGTTFETAPERKSSPTTCGDPELAFGAPPPVPRTIPSDDPTARRTAAATAIAHRRGRRWGGRGCGVTRPLDAAKLKIVLEDLALQLDELRPGLEAELVGESLPAGLEQRQRLCLPPRPIESEHELAERPLAERLVAHEPFELWNELGGCAEREIGLDPLFNSE